VSNTGTNAAQPSNFEGTNGDLLVQPRPNQVPQLTLSFYDADGLAKLQSDLRDRCVAFSRVNKTDIVLSAIAMAQASALLLNVNAFMAAMYSVVPQTERPLIPIALRELFNWVDIHIPTSDLDIIFNACRR
jgi:hypothetical protein